MKTLWIGLLAAGLATAQTTENTQQDEGTYQGPQILSRTSPDTSERGGALLTFRPYAQASYVYDNGLQAVSLNSAGHLVDAGTQQGINAGFGIMGSRRWRFDQLSLDYHGDYTNYSPSSFFNGTSQYLGLNYTHIFSPRWRLAFRENAGISPYSYGQLDYISLQNPGLNGLPSNELFDNRTIFSQTGFDLTYQFSRRLSFNFGGDGYLVRRRSKALAGLNGGRGRADLAYRFSKKQTISAAYSYSDYNYQGAFGSATISAFSLGYAVTLTRNWNFAAEAGALRTQTVGLSRVPLDPAVAAIVGPGYTTVVIKPVDYSPLFKATLKRNFERASLAFTADVSASPGNGVYLLSRSQNYNVSYSYVARKRITYSLFSGYSSLSSVAQQIGAYHSFNSGAGFTYKLTRIVFATLRYDYRHYQAQGFQGVNGVFYKNENRLSLGLAFSPGDRPLPIW